MGLRNPLNVTHYRQMKELQRQLKDLRELLDKSTSCGINCQNECEACDSMQHFLTQLEVEFFTPPPLEAMQPGE